MITRTHIITTLRSSCTWLEEEEEELRKKRRSSRRGRQR
jgi:hypothetical protein